VLTTNISLPSTASVRTPACEHVETWGRSQKLLDVGTLSTAYSYPFNDGVGPRHGWRTYAVDNGHTSMHVFDDVRPCRQRRRA